MGAYQRASLSGIPYRAFVPVPLPPTPALTWTAELEDLRDQANRALGRLDGITAVLPGTSLFLYQYVRKEAVLSSQIEGTRSSLSDLLLYELDDSPGVPIDDVREVSNYVAAMDYGLQRIRDGFPISLRLLREMHSLLLRDSRGQHKESGAFRSTQVWLGGPSPDVAEFVPPPPDQLMLCLDALEKFLHDDPEPTPLLVKIALSHVQFETIHPFKDGNGRLGRLLITLLLCSEGVLNDPLLYLSLYFKQNRQSYYDRLQLVRSHGDWEGWMRFFLQGMHEVAQQAVTTAEKVLALFDEDREQLQRLRQGAGSAIRIHQLLQRRPIISAPLAASELSLSVTAVNNALARLEKIGMVRETTGQQRYRRFAYDAYLAILAEGTEPLD